MDIDTGLLREWVISEIESAIAYNEVGSDGCRGNNYYEKENADQLFYKVVNNFYLNSHEGEDE